MDIVKTLKLDPCTRCNGQVLLLKNSRGYFQVRCSKCGRRTDWLRKTDAVICWLKGIDLHQPAISGDHLTINSTL